MVQLFFFLKKSVAQESKPLPDILRLKGSKISTTGTGPVRTDASSPATNKVSKDDEGIESTVRGTVDSRDEVDPYTSSPAEGGESQTFRSGFLVAIGNGDEGIENRKKTVWETVF